MEKCVVFLPVFNGEKYLRECIESILNQKVQNMRLEIVDDCSTDSSFDIAMQYAERFPTVVNVQRNQRNLGVGKTFRQCFTNYLDAGYFAQIGQDDVWPTGYLKSQIKKLDVTDATAVFANSIFIDENGEKIRTQELFKPWLIDENKEQLLPMLIKGNFLCASSSVIDLRKFPKDTVHMFWGYNNEQLQDWEFWMNASMIGPFVYNPDVTIKYRRHSNNLSLTNRRFEQVRMECYSAIDRLIHGNLFKNYLQSMNEGQQIETVENIVDAIEYCTSKCKYLEVLLISFCEDVLNHGIESKHVKEVLCALYRRRGLINKCKKEERLYELKIKIVPIGKCIHDRTVMLMSRDEDFLVSSTNDSDSLYIVYREELKDFLDDKLFFLKWYFNKTMIIDRGESHEMTDIDQRYVIYSSDEINDVKKKVFGFYEEVMCGRMNHSKNTCTDSDEIEGCLNIATEIIDERTYEVEKLKEEAEALKKLVDAVKESPTFVTGKAINDFTKKVHLHGVLQKIRK